MSLNGAHPWSLVAPWYRWEALGVTSRREARSAPPVFQKFDRPDFVDGFLRDPQRSLKFQDIDRVSIYTTSSAVLGPGSPHANKIASLYAPSTPDARNTTHAQKVHRERLPIRKLFLATHRRYYAVVCELHCDVPNFPNALDETPCQAGFVVRRQRFQYSANGLPEARKIAKRVAEARMELAKLEGTVVLRGMAARRRDRWVEQLVRESALEPTRQKLREGLEAALIELRNWQNEFGAFWVQEGWIPSAHDRVGAWEIVEDRPGEIVEATYPMYRLNANDDPEHDARGRAIYFGVVPSSSLDTDPQGRARFDDVATYEIRCFVRRHAPACPRRVDAPDCKGPLTWSEATEVYRLASQVDLEGTSNRPVTIQMPNLEELAAQAQGPFGKHSPVRVVHPQMLQPKISGMVPNGGEFPGNKVCFVSIPLITIVAMFVLNLFLPIVVFIFNLWFLLVFKFCITPKVSVAFESELDAIARVASAGVDLDAQPDIEGLDPQDLREEFRNGLTTEFKDETGVEPDLNDFALSPLASLQRAHFEAAKRTRDEGPNVGVDLTGDLVYEPRYQPMVIA